MESSAPRDESERLASLRKYSILDTLPEQQFDDLTLIAAQICGVPIALITLIDSDRQWFKSNVGLSFAETSREIAFCAHAIEQPDLFIIPDALKDERFANNPLVTADPDIRFYAGAPLITSEGLALGTLCVIDRVPRELSAAQQEALRALSRQVMAQLELRRQAGELAQANEALEKEATERKQIEEHLRLLESVSVNANDAILITEAEPIDGPGPKIIYVNEAFTRTTGYTASEVIGKTPRILQGAKSDRAQLDKIRAALSIWQPVQAELVNYRKDGTEFWSELNIAPVANERGWFTHWVSVQRDTTERREMEDALRKAQEELEMQVEERTRELTQTNQTLKEQIAEREKTEASLKDSERRYRLLGEGIPDQVWTAQPDGHLDYVNRRTLEYFGLKMEQGIGNGWQDAVHPDDLPQSIERWTQSLQTGENYEMEFRLRGADGIYCWHLARATAGRDSSGKIIKWFGTNTDINDRKRAEEALHGARTQLDAVLEAGAIATWDYDVLNNRIAAGRNLAKLFSVTPGEEVEGALEHYTRAIHADDLPRVEAGIAASAERGSKYESEYRVVQPDGPVRWVFARGQVERDAAGTAIRMSGVMIDTTERKQAEQSLVESEERLQQSQKMESIGTLAGGVAHDFNNLLTAILGNTQLALRKLSPEDSMGPRLVEIEKAGNRAAALTRQLLAFSRRQRLERKSINLNDTINETLKLLQRIIGEDIDVRFNAVGNLSRIYADPSQIEQVVMNLAVNARDAMPRGGRLIIETHNIVLDAEYCRRYPDCKPGKYAQLMVSDTGIGMDAETRARIFEPFFTTKEVGKGTGLGLSMIYGIVKQHDGLIQVYSEVGHGTTFKIYFPIEEKRIADQETEVTLAPMRGGTETILVAEDEEALRELAQSILEELGYRVMLAQDGAEAVEMYQTAREQIGLVLLDVVMPRMGGYEAYERMRSLRSDVPVIFMTGYSTEHMQSKFIEASDAPVIQKPYSVEGLGRAVRTMLDGE